MISEFLEHPQPVSQMIHAGALLIISLLLFMHYRWVKRLPAEHEFEEDLRFSNAANLALLLAILFSASAIWLGDYWFCHVLVVLMITWVVTLNDTSKRKFGHSDNLAVNTATGYTGMVAFGHIVALTIVTPMAIWLWYFGVLGAMCIILIIKTIAYAEKSGEWDYVDAKSFGNEPFHFHLALGAFYAKLNNWPFDTLRCTTSAPPSKAYQSKLKRQILASDWGIESPEAYDSMIESLLNQHSVRGTKEELNVAIDAETEKVLTVWDTVRLIMLARTGYSCDYIERERCLEILDAAAAQITSLCNSWEDLATTFAAGRSAWGGGRRTTTKITKYLLTHSGSPWLRLRWPEFKTPHQTQHDAKNF